MDKIIPIPAFEDNYIWLGIDSKKKQAFCVDPGDAKPVTQALQRYDLQLKAILVTHHHFDHCGGIDSLCEHHDVPVYAPAQENIPHASLSLQHKQQFELSGLSISMQALHIPGHTLGHMAFYGLNTLFCGDTLFAGGCGRLFEGSAEQMYHSLQTLNRLPKQTHIYCGHEYTEKKSTICAPT
jgi:hydroxyacylglutathione hydrolase